MGTPPVQPAHPSGPDPAAVTVLLGRIARGEARAGDELIPLVYEELRRMARGQMAREPRRGAANTLTPTGLVHEAYLKMVAGKDVCFESRAHFFASAARSMRQILVDRARARLTSKRGGKRRRVELAEDVTAEPEEVLGVDTALAKLEITDPRKAQVVMLRYYAGLSIEETSAALDLSAATVKNDWNYARAWLRRELSNETSESGGGGHA
jgi:RNA polymerase sigma factor (TIGR02999 family)